MGIRQLGADQTVDANEITLDAFVTYSREYTGWNLGSGSQVREPVEAIRTFQAFISHADDNGYNPRLPMELKDRLLSALRTRLPEDLRSVNADQLAVTDSYLLTDLARPILPTLPLIRLSRESHLVIKCLATIGLVVETIFRELASLGISCVLRLYSHKNAEGAAYYQLRLDMNRHAPFKALTGKVLSAVGGY